MTHNVSTHCARAPHEERLSFRELHKNQSLPDIEKEVLEFWDSDDTFRIGDTFYYGRSTDVTFIVLMDGRFRDGWDEMSGTYRIRVVSVGMEDCEICMIFNATRI